MNNAIEKILKIHYNVSSIKAANIIFFGRNDRRKRFKMEDDIDD